MEIQINYIAVVVAAVAAMIVGFVWYGPLFGKLWMSLMGLSPERLNELKKKGMGPTYAVALVSSFVMAFVLAHFANIWKAQDIWGAFELALWPWLGFVATTMVNSVLWENKSWKLYGLNVSHQLVSMFVMALILVFWQK